jgi:hypothetical protein
MKSNEKLNEQVLYVGLDNECIKPVENLNIDKEIQSCNIEIRKITIDNFVVANQYYSTSCAVVFIISNEALNNHNFLELLDIAREEAVKRVDFRLFLLLEGIDKKAFFKIEFDNERPEPLRQTVKGLIENIHVSGIQDPELIKDFLCDYINHINDVRKSFSSHVRNLKTKKLVCQVADSMFYIFMALFVLLHLIDLRPVVGANNEFQKPIVDMLMLGFLVSKSFPALLVRYTYGKREYWNSVLIYRFWASLFTIGLAFWFSYYNAPYLGFLFIGLLSGLFIGVMRRKFSKASIELNSLKYEYIKQFKDNTISKSVHAVDPMVNDAAHAQSSFYLNCPLFTKPVHKSVFISYSHDENVLDGEKWGAEKAKEISDYLEKNKIDCFLDENVIPEGGAWRFWVFSGIHQCSLLILLLNKYSTERTWPAAEAEFALRTMYEVGNPMMLVVPESKYLLRESEKKGTKPVFHAICGRLFGTSWGEGVMNFPLYAPCPSQISEKINEVDLENINESIELDKTTLDKLKNVDEENIKVLLRDIKNNLIISPGLTPISLYRLMIVLTTIFEHLYALLSATAIYFAYLFVFGSCFRFEPTSFSDGLVLGGAIIYSFLLGFLSRLTWKLDTFKHSEKRKASLVYRIWMVLICTILVFAILLFYVQLPLWAQILVFILPLFGWLASQFSVIEDRARPFWSIVKDNSI